VVTLTPPGTISPDLAQSPIVINNIYLSTNWTTLHAAWGTTWGNWVDYGAVANTTSSPTSVTTTNPDGSSTTVTTTQTTSATTQQRAGTQLNAQTNDQQFNLGTYVTNIGILPFLSATRIVFTAHGLKPNTRVYAYFSNVKVSDHCAPLDSTLAGTGVVGDKTSGVFGDPLYTDSTGSLYGAFYLPAGTFSAQENTFLLADISDLTQGSSAIQTQASAQFYGSTLSFSTGSTQLNTRNTVLVTQDITDTQTIYSTTNNVVITTNTAVTMLPNTAIANTSTVDIGAANTAVIVIDTTIDPPSTSTDSGTYGPIYGDTGEQGMGGVVGWGWLVNHQVDQSGASQFGNSGDGGGYPPVYDGA